MIWIRNIIEFGSLGRLLNRIRDVIVILVDRIFVLFRLNIVFYLLLILIGIGLGIWVVFKKNKLIDYLILIGVVIFIFVLIFVVVILL